MNQQALSQLSNADLQALTNKDYMRMSNQGLRLLSGEAPSVKKESPTQARSSWKNFLNVQKNEALGLAQGVLDFGADLGDLYIRSENALNGVVDKGIRGLKHHGWLPPSMLELGHYPGHAPRTHLLNPKQAATSEAKVGHFMGEVVPSLALPESRLAQSAATLFTKGGKAVGLLGHFFTKTLPRFVDAGVTGGSQAAVYNAGNKKQSLPNSFLTGAALGAGLHTVFGAVPGLTENYFRRIAQKARTGKNALRTPDQVAALHQQLDGVPAHIAHILNMLQAAQRSASALRMVPFSNVGKLEDELASHTQRHANELLQILLGESDSALIENEIINAIGANKKSNTRLAKQQFETIADKADQLDITIQPTQLRKAAQAILNENKQSLFSTLDTATRKVLNTIKSKANYRPSFKAMHFNHSELGKRIKELRQKGELGEASKLSILQDAVVQDMESALQEHAASHLLPQWTKARAYFKGHVVPYRHKAVYHWLEGSHTNQLLNKLLSKDHQAVYNELSRPIKDKLAYLYFSKSAKKTLDANHVIDPAALARAYQKMPESLRQRLLTLEQQNDFHKLMTLMSVSKSTPISSSLPLNKLRSLELLKLSGELGGLKYLLGSGVAALKTGGASVLGNRWLAKYLYSPKARQHYIQQTVGNASKRAKRVTRLAAPLNYVHAKVNHDTKH